MSGSMLSSAALDERRRKILFRAWRRGMREMDLVMGQFADANLPAMSEADLDEFERLLEAPDPQVLAWITGEEADALRVRHAAVRAPAGTRRARALAKDRQRPVTNLAPAARRLAEGGAVTLGRAPEGYDAFVVAELTRALASAGEARAVTLVFVARDSVRAQAFIDALGFAAPEIEALFLPSWDCQPYDRVSPNAAVSAERMTVLARLARTRGAVERPRILVGSVSALTQRVPPLKYVASAAFSAAPGNSVRMDELALWLETNGYARASTVRDVGDYATRGGILDLYPPGAPAPIRLDFFGDTLESIRAFDPETQRSVGQLRSLDLVPMSEARLDDRDDPPLPPGLRRRIRRADARRRPLCRGQRRPPRDRPRALAAAALRQARHAVRLCRRRALRARRARRGGGGPAHRADRRLLRRAPRSLCPGPGQGRLQAAAARAALPDRRRMEGAARRPRRWRASRPSRRARARRMSSIAAAGSGAISPPSGRTRTPTCSTPPSRISGHLRERGLNVDRRRLERRLARAAEPCARRARPEIDRARLVLPSGEDRARGRAAARGDRARTGVRGARPGDRRRAGHSRRPARPPVEAQAARAGRAGRSERADRGRSRRPHRPRRRALRRLARRSRRRARRTTASKSITPAATGCSCRSRTSSSCRATARRRANSTGSAARAGSRARRGSRSACAKWRASSSASPPSA